jgi:hypothetical protein
MRKAAAEWLAARAAGDALEPYLDRWVYDHSGYQRADQT